MPPLHMDYILHNPNSQRKTPYNQFRNDLCLRVNYSACCVDEDGSFEGVSEIDSSASDAVGSSSVSDVAARSSDPDVAVDLLTLMQSAILPTLALMATLLLLK